MKTLLCAALFLVLIFSGCQDQLQNPARPDAPAGPIFDSPAGPITVLALDRNEEEKTIEAMLLVGDRLRRLTIRPHENSTLPVGLTAELSDGSRSLLFGVEVAWDPKTPGLLWLTERTPTDMLTISMRREGDLTLEEYSTRGSTFAVEYSGREFDLRQHIIAQQWGDANSQPVSADLNALDIKAREFEKFYVDNVGATLSGNIDGEILMGLLNDAEFVEDGLDVGDGWFSNLGPDAERVCNYSVKCVSFKCRYGRLANPLCIACGGTGSACVIAAIACHFVNCGNVNEGKEEE